MNDRSIANRNIKQVVIGPKAFAAISAVEGLWLAKTSKKRLRELNADTSLTPEQRRAEVLSVYQAIAKGTKK